MDNKKKTRGKILKYFKYGIIEKYRRLSRLISWVMMKVLSKVGIDRKIWKTIVKKRIRIFEHILRYLRMVFLMPEGIVEGKSE